MSNTGGDSAESSAGVLQKSIWEHPENSENAPKFCPHCGNELAHPDDLRDNDHIDAVGLFSAYQRHREAHFAWGDDPRQDGVGRGDPYLASHYAGDKSAMWEPDEGASGDPEEVVGHVYDVDIRYEATCRARVVAHSESRAKEKAEELRLGNSEDLCGDIVEAHIGQELHTYTTEVDDVLRADELAERMEGWPW